jgi:hypothetical protein
MKEGRDKVCLPGGVGDSDVLPVQVVSHFGGRRSGRVRNPMDVLFVIEHFYRAQFAIENRNPDNNILLWERFIVGGKL